MSESSLYSSPDVFQIATTTAADISAYRVGQSCCRAIHMLAAGNLQFTNPAGVSRTFTSLPAGVYMIQAKAIGVSTTSSVLVYF